MTPECCTRDPHQIYGLPKIHKPGNPLRPIVSFYGAPLPALHKQLAHILKSLTMSKLRLKNSEDFPERFRHDVDPYFTYYSFLDVKSLYTTWDMHAAVNITMDKLRSHPEILPVNITAEGIHSLLNFSLDNSYLEFDSRFFRQNIGGTMGSPLTVALAEIRVLYIEELAISSGTNLPKHYYYVVDDGFGYFRSSQHAESFLNHINSLVPDIEYTIEVCLQISLPTSPQPPPPPDIKFKSNYARKRDFGLLCPNMEVRPQAPKNEIYQKIFIFLKRSSNFASNEPSTICRHKV